MSPRLGRKIALSRIAAVAIALGALGCHDASLTGTPPSESLPPGASGAGLISGSVDADGTVSFDPIASSAARLAPGVSAAIYGDQNVTVLLYSNNFSVDSTSAPGTKTWSFDVGLRNYLDFPIGSNQNGPTPSDTLGVYVVIVSDPIVTSTNGNCSGSACSVKLATSDGVGNFTAPGQKYYYWRERLAARQPTAGADTTSIRKHWVFTSPSSVTGFRFVLMVSAAWPPAHDASWNVYYDAATDSLPDTRAEPRWKPLVLPTLFGISSPGTETWSPAGLEVGATNGQNLFLYRADSLAPDERAYIEARLSVNASGTNDYANTVFGLIDSDHTAAVAISDGRVGFATLRYDTLWIFGNYNYRWEFIGTTYQLSNNGGRKVHSYRLRKFGADSVRLELDGTRVLSMRVSQLPASTSPQGDITAFFGVTSYNSSPTSTWSHITYNFGTTQP